MTAKTEPARGLHAKLAEVMAEAGRIPKNGTAPAQMGGYKFVQVGDAADAIRRELGKRNVSMLPTEVEVIGEAEHETRSGGTMTTLRIRTTWTLTDGDTAESIAIQSVGEGADSGDKAAPKAQTNAMKYALLMGFLLSTGDDPEQGATERGRRAAPPQNDVAKQEETLAPIGPIARTGVIGKGEGVHSRLEFKQTPDGYHLGFRLLVAGKTGTPQVVAQGPIGAALYALGDPEKLLGMQVDVEGDLFEVHFPGRKSYHRLYLTRIASAEWVIPPDELPEVESLSMGLDAEDEQAVGEAMDAALPPVGVSG